MHSCNPRRASPLKTLVTCQRNNFLLSVQHLYSPTVTTVWQRLVLFGRCYTPRTRQMLGTLKKFSVCSINEERNKSVNGSPHFSLSVFRSTAVRIREALSPWGVKANGATSSGPPRSTVRTHLEWRDATWRVHRSLPFRRDKQDSLPWPHV